MTTPDRPAGSLPQTGPACELTLEGFIASAPLGMCVLDAQGRFVQVSPALLQSLGYRPEQLLGQAFSRLLSHGMRAALVRRHRQLIEEGAALRGECVLLDGQGHARAMLIEACRLDDGADAPRVLAVLIDIGARKARERELLERNRVLASMAAADSLTGLYNRRRTLEVLQRLLRAANRYQRPLVVAMIDLDDFKTVNDRHGHAVGDEVLVAFARLLKALSRDSDCAGRIGGEEFLLVLPESDCAGASRLLDRLREACQSLRFSVPGLHINFSAGLYSRQPGDAISTLLRHADQALYAAKRQGRARHCIWPTD